MELDELHVLQRQPGAQRHGAAISGAGMRRGTGRIGAAIAAGGENGGLRAELMQRAVVELQRDHAAANALVIHDQVDGEKLDIEFRGVTQRLAVHGVQHGVAGAVGGGASPLRLALAVVQRHAAERALIDLAVLGARERHAPMFQLVNGFRCVAHHIFDGVLIAEPVRPLDGVVHMPAPIVRMHVAERRGDAALGGYRMRARRKYLGDTGGAQPGLAAADHRAQTRAAGADHDDVIGMVFDRIGLSIGGGATAAIGSLPVGSLAVAVSGHVLHSTCATLQMTV